MPVTGKTSARLNQSSNCRMTGAAPEKPGIAQIEAPRSTGLSDMRMMAKMNSEHDADRHGENRHDDRVRHPLRIAGTVREAPDIGPSDLARRESAAR